MKKGLVMEGGAMRGLFTAGVIDVAMENKIKFDGAIGVSAGAAFGCNYKSNQPGRVLRYNIKYSNDIRYCSFKSLIKTGNLYNAQFCYHEIPEKFDLFDVQTFNNSPMEFYLVCTNIITGEPVYKKCERADNEFLEWIRASSSIPVISKVVEIDGYKLLDGGISDAIPLKYFETIGYNKNVIILTQPLEYVKKKNKYLGLIQIYFKKYPRLIEQIRRRHEMYNNTIKYICEKEKQGDIFVIRPQKTLNIGCIEHNAKKMEEIYKLGRDNALSCIDDMKYFLNS